MKTAEWVTLLEQVLRVGAQDLLGVIDSIPPLIALAGGFGLVGAYQLWRVGLEKWLYGEPIGPRALVGGCVLSASAILGELASL